MSTVSRPTRWSMIREGTLPLRNPGMLICEAIFLYAASTLGWSSSKGTSTLSLTRVGLRVSTADFTDGSYVTRVGTVMRPGLADPRRPGRGDRTRTCDLLLPKQAR